MNARLDRDAVRALLDRPDLAPVLAALDGDGEETRIVGGAVRNALLGRPVTDIDLATTAPPPAVAARARAAGLKAVPTGIAHGTVTVVAHGAPFEVTTLREDVETDGRHATVRFGRDFAADALRRDFTINALSVARTGAIADHTGGLDDLAAGRVRFIGVPRERIREDYLRILRFFRFSAEYAAGPPDPEGLAAVIRERDGLDRLSRERVRTELLKLLVARNAAPVLSVLSDTGLLGRLTGGVAEHGRFARAAGQDAAGRLAALLVRTREDADGLRLRLRLSNGEHGRLLARARLLEELRSAAAPAGRSAVRRWAASAGAVPLVEALDTLAGEPRPDLAPDGADQARRYRDGEPAPVFPLTGGDLVSAGIPAGRDLGRRLEAERRAWLDAGCPDAWMPVLLPAPPACKEGA